MSSAGSDGSSYNTTELLKIRIRRRPDIVTRASRPLWRKMSALRFSLLLYFQTLIKESIKLPVFADQQI